MVAGGGFGAVPGQSWSRRRLAPGGPTLSFTRCDSPIVLQGSRSADLAVRLKCDVVAHLSSPAPLAGGRIETTRMCRLRIRTQSGKAIWVSLGAGGVSTSATAQTTPMTDSQRGTSPVRRPTVVTERVKTAAIRAPKVMSSVLARTSANRKVSREVLGD